MTESIHMARLPLALEILAEALLPFAKDAIEPAGFKPEIVAATLKEMSKRKTIKISGGVVSLVAASTFPVNGVGPMSNVNLPRPVDAIHASSKTNGRAHSAAEIDRSEHGGEVPTDLDTLREGDDPAVFTAPFLAARALIKPHRLKPEKLLQKLAKQLPVWPWVEAIHGFGPLGLAQIIGEAGDLSQYSSPAKLWKRMGLAVIDGRAQRKARGEEGIKQAYSPARRSVMWNVGDKLFRWPNVYRDIYLARKIIEKQKDPDCKIPKIWHRRAQRYMEKRLLRDLWRAWKKLCTKVSGEDS